MSRVLEPTLKVVVRNPVGTAEEKVLVKLDTGFSGGLFLPFETYVGLGLQLFELPPVTAVLATGETVRLSASRAVVVVGRREYPCTVYTTLRASTTLLGLEVLSRLRVTLDGKKQAVTVEDP